MDSACSSMASRLSCSAYRAFLWLSRSTYCSVTSSTYSLLFVTLDCCETSVTNPSSRSEGIRTVRLALLER